MSLFQKYDATLLVLIVVVALILIGIGPLITIWTLNTLFFAGAIGYTFKNWVAILLLQMTIAGLTRGKS